MIANIFSAEVCRELSVEQSAPFIIDHIPSQHAAGVLVERDYARRILSRRILIGDVALHQQERFTVAHELVHWYAQGIWDRLPQAVEEGLADSIAMKLAPELSGLREAELNDVLAEVTPARRQLALTVTERNWIEVPAQVRSDAYAVGFEVVRRLGIPRLRELCEQAEARHLDRVPLEWLE